MSRKKVFVLCFLFLISLVLSLNKEYDIEVLAATNKPILDFTQDNEFKKLEKTFSKKELEILRSRGFSLDSLELYILSGESKKDILKRKSVSNSIKNYIITTETDLDKVDLQPLYIPFIKVEEVNNEEFLRRFKEDEKNEKSRKKKKSGKNIVSSTSYKTMTVSLSKKKKNVYTVINTVDWTRGALITKKDIIGIGINNNTSPIPGTEYGIQKWYYKYPGSLIDSQKYTKKSTKWNRSADYGLTVDLANGGLGCIRCIKHKVSMKYDVTPNVGSVRIIDAYGHYAHQESKFTITPAFTISKGVLGISVSQQDDYVIHKPQPHVQIKK